METLNRLRATCVLMFAALCLASCASGPPQDGPRGDWGKAPRQRPDEGGPRPPHRQLFISPAGEPFRAEPGAPYPVAAWFAGADANHDGALNRDEFVADAVRFFAVVDADHSGVIDGFEVSAYETQVAPEILQGFRGGQGEGGSPGAERAGRRAGPPGGGGRLPMGGMLQGATPYSMLAEPQPVMGADGDFDRRITREEAIRAAKSRFALLDTDRDGLLRLADLPRTPAQARSQGARSDRTPPKH